MSSWIFLIYYCMSFDYLIKINILLESFDRRSIIGKITSCLHGFKNHWCSRTLYLVKRRTTFKFYLSSIGHNQLEFIKVYLIFLYAVFLHAAVITINTTFSTLKSAMIWIYISTQISMDSTMEASLLSFFKGKSLLLVHSVYLFNIFPVFETYLQSSKSTSIFCVLLILTCCLQKSVLRWRRTHFKNHGDDGWYETPAYVLGRNGVVSICLRVWVMCLKKYLAEMIDWL